MIAPIGYFVHHQGRGHAERCAAIVNALPAERPVALFCARDDIFPLLRANVRIHKIPSLFEAAEQAERRAGARARVVRTPDTLHCAPLGWDGITHAIAQITAWMRDEQPALLITDVSAEIAQLARIASIPCIPVLQHGDRDDPGHRSAYEGAVGILAPYAAILEQPARPRWMAEKTTHAAGIGIGTARIDREKARAALGIDPDVDLVLVIGGGGGEGLPVPPMSLGARAEPDSLWVTIGQMAPAWHDTPPVNLVHRGWVDNATTWIAAADRIVSSAGNTTVHQVAATDAPWLVVPEWRYFAEQLWKARMLARAGAATMREHWPASAAAWHAVWDEARALDPAPRRQLVDPLAAEKAARWIERVAGECWDETPIPALLIAEPIA